jgi:hypothetical protein
MIWFYSLTATCFNCGEAACIVCGDCRRDYNAGETVHFCVQCSATVHRNPTRAGHNPEREDWFGELELLSVLCIETSHYVCFSRDHEGRWVFFDSMADRVCELPLLNKPLITSPLPPPLTR